MIGRTSDDGSAVEDRPVSVGDLFAGALLPGILLVGMYLAWLAIVAMLRPAAMPAHHESRQPGLVGVDEGEARESQQVHQQPLQQLEAAARFGKSSWPAPLAAGCRRRRS